MVRRVRTGRGRTQFRAHLEGRVGFVETMHAEKGQRLRAVLERIQWAQ